MTRIYRARNVLDEALARIEWVFDEFPTVAVSMSGGKDSTVIFHLTQMVAERRGVERVPVMWLDQECEFQATVDYMREIMHRPDVDPYWLQIPFRLLNATSTTDQWLNVWGEGEQWVRDREPDSIHENTYGTDRFKKLMHAVADHHWPGGAVLTGLRVEESPARLLGLTGSPKYKWVTWGRKNPHHLNLSPIYDWGYRDVWKAIHEHGWAYNRHYDEQYRYGVRVMDMRVSNYHHETAVHHLFHLQEMEPETYERATARLSGIATAATLGKSDYFVHELPFMFTSWREYRDYLAANLLDPEQVPRFLDKFAAMEHNGPGADPTKMCKAQVQSILANDVEFTKLDNFMLSLPREQQRRRQPTHERQAGALAAIEGASS